MCLKECSEKGPRPSKGLMPWQSVGQYGRYPLSWQVLINSNNVTGSEFKTSLKIWQMQEKYKFGNSLKKLKIFRRSAVKKCCNNNNQFSVAKSLAEINFQHQKVQRWYFVCSADRAHEQRDFGGEMASASEQIKPRDDKPLSFSLRTEKRRQA